ncbi:NAD(P)-bd-dom domain-containing protein [Aphelenchoides fujianensis]|nr:NAD(P)-bd-dom domain-containing protein [Aphelenchoides fujianensis]
MAETKPKNLLVTGGCGFIGANFVNFAFDFWPEARIVNLDKLILNSDVNYVAEEVRQSARYSLVLADIRNAEIDTIIHFAADCTSTRCYADPCEAMRNNVLSFVDFLKAVTDYGQLTRFVHISTDEVYGDSGLGDEEQGKAEDEPLRPGNPYAATKIAGEHFVRLFQHEHGLPLVMLRINNIYGPNQWDVKLVPRFIQVARAGGKFPVQGSGQQLRSWLFVDDASRGVCLATERGRVGEVYNLGTYFEKNVLELAHAVQKEVERELNELRGTHVLCCTGRTHGGGLQTIEYLEGGAEKTLENVRDNLFCPLQLATIARRLGLHFTYLGTAYLFAYDRRASRWAGGRSASATCPRSSATPTRCWTTIATCSRNFLKYNQIFDLPVSITILPDCVPALVQLMERREGGPLNLVNPRPISLHEILQLYKQIADPALPAYSVITADSEKGRQIVATKGNCALDTARLQELCPEIKDSVQSLTQGFQQLKSSEC